MKTCSKCHAVKSLDEFGRHSQTPDGLKSRCRVCNATEAREYGAKNAGKVALARAQYYANNTDKVRSRINRYAATNAEKLRQTRAAYRTNNPEVARRSNAKRRARKLQIVGNLSPGIVARLLVCQKNKCINCRCDLRKSGHHLDHIHPLNLQGEHCDANMQLLCPRCNLSKHAKHPVKWAQMNGRLL